MINNTFVFNPVRTNFIRPAIETLYKYTEMGGNRVVVVDQTLDGIGKIDGVHLVIKPHRNLGFAKSMNEGIIHGRHWGSKYITCCNDDIEFINKRWWDGILETFNQDEKILAVNPMSPREPGWGYGLEHGKYIDLIDYKETYTEEDYDYLLEGDFSAIQGLPDTFPKKKVGVIDAIATWCTVFKREFFDKFGMYDERFYPGGSEDYDLDARCYSCAWPEWRDECNPEYHSRMVGTTRSWVWHHWGSSKDKQGELGKGLPIIDELRWNNTDEIWKPELNEGTKYDPWGHYHDKNGIRKPSKRIKEVTVIDI
jgi:hypothetical protein